MSRREEGTGHVRRDASAWGAAHVLALLVGLAALVVGFWWWTRPAAPAERPPALTLSATTPEGSYARALEPIDFSFPEDHGPHPEYQTEWWYYTGNLEGSDGRRFAYQLTFFRRALAPSTDQPSSALGARQIYFAHFALMDIAEQRHLEGQSFSREAGGLAGAQQNPFRVWIESWSLEGLNPDASRVRLKAEQDGYAIDLTLDSLKPIVAHGDRGLSAKSEAPGNASYYLSYTRMATEGEIRVDGQLFEVTGSSWFDHEWSTSALGPQEVGWDWFSLQLSDESEVMYFRLRRQDGSVAPASSGTLIEPDGSTDTFSWRQVDLQELGTWTSPDSGATYPSGWRLRIRPYELDLVIEPWFDAQEMNANVVYWEGAVQVEGDRQGQPLKGQGFVELTGYAESIQGSF